MRVKEVENLVQVDEEKGGGKELQSGATPPLWRFQSSCLSWPEIHPIELFLLECKTLDTVSGVLWRSRLSGLLSCPEVSGFEGGTEGVDPWTNLCHHPCN